MILWHGYFLIEDLGMTTTQRNAIIELFKAFGDSNSIHPPFRNHRRARLDNKAVIFEASFDVGNLTIASFKEKLAEVFSITPDSISHSISNGFVTFSKNGDKLLMKLFGSLESTWEESNTDCLNYLKTNSLKWETEEV